MADVIDTLEIAHELRDAGVPERQAEAIARQFKRRYEADRADLVTRAYLDHALERHAVELRAELERHMAELRAELASQRVESKAELDRHVAELRAELARLERDLILKLGGVITLAVALVGALGVLF
jgi:malate synthase